ncbi:MAG: hypothetical protein ACE5G5_04245 [Candidatus Methylomirabilales bacterium]
MFAWSSSPSLEKIHQGLEEQQRIAGQLIRYLQERFTPIERHVGEHRRLIDQALKHLDSRLVPLRQYIQGEQKNVNRVIAHLDAGLRDQFEAFDQFLTRQNEVLEDARHFLDEQPRPLHTYLEDERVAVETVFRDLEQRLDRFMANLAEQQKILESLRQPDVIAEYGALTEYLEERQRAIERYAQSAGHRPAEFFAELDEIANRYKSLETGERGLFAKVLRGTRLADEMLQQALCGPARSPQTHPGDSTLQMDVSEGLRGNGNPLQPDVGIEAVPGNGQDVEQDLNHPSGSGDLSDEVGRVPGGTGMFGGEAEEETQEEVE